MLYYAVILFLNQFFDRIVSFSWSLKFSPSSICSPFCVCSDGLCIAAFDSKQPNCCRYCNRASRIECSDLANKMFEGGSDAGKFKSSLSDLYKGVTDLNVESGGNKKNPMKLKKRSMSRFFG